MLTRRRFVASAAAFIAIGAIGSASLAGCAPAAGDSQERELAKLTVGCDAFPPFVRFDENGEPSGIDVEILRTALARLGYEPVFEFIPWEDKDALLEGGDVDIVASCFSMTGREELYQWAGPYMRSRQVACVVPESAIEALADLEDKIVAVQSTTKPEEIILKDLNPDVPKLQKLYCFEDRDLLYPALSKGYVDAVCAHETSIQQYESDYGVEYRILDEPLLEVELGYAFYKGDTRGIAAKLDQVLHDLHADGTLAQIVVGYLGEADKYLEGVDALEG